jgi:hypothetical protein
MMTLISILLIGWSESWNILKNAYIQITLGFITIYFLCLKFRTHSFIYKQPWGGVFGIILFCSGSIIGSLTSMLIYKTFDLSYLYKPLFYLLIFGLIPAFSLGLLFTHLLQISNSHQKN